MTTQQVAGRLTALCRTGQILQAQEELYTDDITCKEPEHAPTQSRLPPCSIFKTALSLARSAAYKNSDYEVYTSTGGIIRA